MIKDGIQTPDAPNTWLYQDQEQGRLFTDYVILGKEAEPWEQCTDEQMYAWKAEHPEPETID